MYFPYTEEDISFQSAEVTEKKCGSEYHVKKPYEGNICVQREKAKDWALKNLNLQVSVGKIRKRSSVQVEKSFQQQKFDAAQHASRLYGSQILNED